MRRVSSILLFCVIVAVTLPESSCWVWGRRSPPPPPPPPPPPRCPVWGGQATNGYITCTNSNYIGSRCTIQCNTGFTTHHTTIVCQSNGQWDASRPSCIPVLCPVISGQGMNGIIKCSSSNSVSSVCTISCNAGYTTAQASVTCQSSGAWTGARPSCSAVRCPPLPAVANGISSCSSPRLGTSPLMGSKCTFICNQGWVKPVSQRGRAVGCTSSGTWSNPPPACIRHAHPTKVMCHPAGVSVTSFTAPVAVTPPPTDFRSADGLRPVPAVCTLGGRYLKVTETLGWGIYNVTCSGTDTEVQLTSYCNYPLHTKQGCNQLPSPANGALVCGPWQGSNIYCQQHCQAGYDLPRFGPNMLVWYGSFICLNSQTWSPARYIYDCEPVGRGSPLVRLPSSMYYTGGSCISAQAQIKQTFISHLTTSGTLDVFCHECGVANVTVYCGK